MYEAAASNSTTAFAPYATTLNGLVSIRTESSEMPVVQRVGSRFPNGVVEWVP